MSEDEGGRPPMINFLTQLGRDENYVAQSRELRERLAELSRELPDHLRVLIEQRDLDGIRRVVAAEEREAYGGEVAPTDTESHWFWFFLILF